MTTLRNNSQMAATAAIKTLKGRPDVKQGCNPCDKTQATTANRPANLSCMVNDCKSIVYKTNNSLKTKTKRAFALLLMLALLAPVAALAQSFGGGSGTETDPYIITTVEHMNQLASAVNNGTSYIFKYFRMDADIDFAGASFKGIGEKNNNAQTGYNMFEGCFDGNGHTIKGMRSIYSTNYHGLFNIIGAIATIKNLTMVDCVIQGGANVGAIAGFMNGNYTETGHGVRNCKVAEDVRVTGTTAVGGIVGSTQGSSDIYGCTFLGTVSGNDWVGAITGHSWTHYAYVVNGNTSVDPDRQSKSCYIGGNCTKGAVGTDGTDGTDEHTSAKHITSVTFADNINGRFGTHLQFQRKELLSVWQHHQPFAFLQRNSTYRLYR